MQGSNENIKEIIGIVSISDYLIFSSNPRYTRVGRTTMAMLSCKIYQFGAKTGDQSLLSTLWTRQYSTDITLTVL